MKRHLAFLTLLLMAVVSMNACNGRRDTDEHEQSTHAAQTKPAPVAIRPRLADSLHLMVRQLDTARRIGCYDEDFARLMSLHHAGAQRLAAVEISQGKDSTLRAMAQHVVKSHEKDTHVLTLALRRDPPGGQEYRPGNARDPFVRRITAALAPLRQLPPLSGTIDADFATLMQQHHQSGVALAQAELAFGRNIEVKDAARRIIRDQQQEIKQFQRWLQAHEPTAPVH